MSRIRKSFFQQVIEAISGNPVLRRFQARQPRFFRFISRLLAPEEKFAFLLTIGAAVALFLVFLFLDALQGFVGHDWLTRFDLRVVDAVRGLTGSSLDEPMLFATYLDNWQVVVLGLVFLIFWFVLSKYWHYAVAFVVSVGGGQALVWMMKHLVGRSRPPLIDALVPEGGFSFPSGHAFAAFSFYGLLVYFLFRAVKSKAARFFLVVVGAALILAIGISRVYLGVHWPSDVLAGYMAGAAWLAVVIIALEILRISGRRDYGRPYLKRSWLVILGIIFFAFWAGFAVYFYGNHDLRPQPAPPSMQMGKLSDVHA